MSLAAAALIADSETVARFGQRLGRGQWPVGSQLGGRESALCVLRARLRTARTAGRHLSAVTGGPLSFIGLVELVAPVSSAVATVCLRPQLGQKARVASSPKGARDEWAASRVTFRGARPLLISVAHFVQEVAPALWRACAPLPLIDDWA